MKDADLEHLFSSFLELKTSWGTAEEEIKGSKLDEGQVAATIHLISQFDVMFELVAVDMALQSEKALTDSRHRQADVFISGIDERFNESLVTRVLGYVLRRKSWVRRSPLLDGIVVQTEFNDFHTLELK